MYVLFQILKLSNYTLYKLLYKWVDVFGEPLSWEEAHLKCQQIGYRLLQINSYEEWLYLDIWSGYNLRQYEVVFIDAVCHRDRVCLTTQIYICSTIGLRFMFIAIGAKTLKCYA